MPSFKNPTKIDKDRRRRKIKQWCNEVSVYYTVIYLPIDNRKKFIHLACNVKKIINEAKKD